MDSCTWGRFIAKVSLPGPDGCMLWKGRKSGYGQLFVGGRVEYAHRLSYTHFNGPLEDDQVVRHSCDNTLCVAPSHLLPGTKKDNAQDMIDRGRQSTYYKDKTHCPKGHEYTSENTRVYRGRRHCRACDRARGSGQQRSKR